MSPTLLTRRAVAGGIAALGVAAAARVAPVASEARPDVRRLSPALDAIVAPGVRPEVIVEGIRWAEGPVWLPRARALLFSDPPANLIRRWRPGRGAEPFLTPSGAGGTDPRLVREPGSNGLLLDRDGALLIANSGGRSIDRFDLATRRRIVLVDRFEGKRFNSPNDLCLARDGAIWFTDPPYGFADGDASPLRELPHNGVYRLDRRGGAELMVADLTRPNGIGLSPDGRRLYVSVSDETFPRIMVYDLDAAGRPRDARVLLDARPMRTPGAAGLPDGMKVARDGTLVCSVPGGMMLMTPEAEPLGLIVSTGAIANCAFGEDGRTLFLANDHRILRLPLARAMAGVE